MFIAAKPRRQWSDIALKALVTSVIMAIALSFAHGVLRGPGAFYNSSAGIEAMIETWVYDLRFLFEQGIYAATVLFIGAKFFETRTVFSVGFDTLDADKMSVKGPDENNVVWVGHRYASALEAEAIAGAISARIQASAEAAAR